MAAAPRRLSSAAEQALRSAPRECDSGVPCDSILEKGLSGQTEFWLEVIEGITKILGKNL
jgi:hypothetical protein